MAITSDITATWRAPRAMIRQMLDAGADEGRAVAILMGALALIFVAQTPRLAREAHLDPSVAMDARMGVTLFALVFMAPLIFYGIAAISHLAARAFGGRGGWYGARLSLFWALLCTVPLMLLQGLVAGLIGPGPAGTVVGVLVAVAFVWLWINMLIEVER
jgi:hypothetical protein